MNYTKNTVDFLKEYVLRYKKILLSICFIIGFLFGIKLYNKWSLWSFNKNLNFTQKQLENNNLKSLNEFFNKYNSKIISHKSIFVLGYYYINAINLIIKLIKQNPTNIPNNVLQLIKQGQWSLVKKNLMNISMDNKNDILIGLDNLEKIYTFVNKRIPYNCVLSGNYIHYYGEILNILVLYHMTHRESKEEVSRFYHKSCSHISVYSSESRLIYNLFLNDREKIGLYMYDDNTKSNLLKKFINF